MRVVGIVCEYNPFHKGHAYQLREARRQCPDAAVVCVQSGDFVQRGEPALFSKYARAEAACRCGADLVIELPLPWSLSSAERFAAGSVALLASCGAEAISFGSESGDVPALSALSRYLASDACLADIRALMRETPSLSFAAARERAARTALGDLASLLRSPNDNLAVEYLRAAERQGLSLRAIPIKRAGAAHDSRENAAFLSGSHLRDKIRAGEDVRGLLPDEAYQLFSAEIAQGRALLDPSRMEIAILSRLRMLTENVFRELPDAEDGAGIRLYEAVRQAESLEDILAFARTKRLPEARIRRMVMAACLGLRPMESGALPPYARVLACGEQGRALLHKRREAQIPFLTKPAAVRSLGDSAAEIFRLGADAHDFLVLGFGESARRPGEDWRSGPCLL